MKRLSVILMLLCLLLCAAARAESKQERLQCGDYIYELLPDGGARVVSDVLLSGGEYVDRIAIPAELDGHPVEEIGEYAFCGDPLEGRSLTTVVLPEGLKRIDEGAFYENDTLIWMRLPASLEQIETGSLALYCAVDRGSYAERYCLDNGISILYADEYGDPDLVTLDYEDDYLYYFIGDGPAAILGFDGHSSGKAVVPSRLGGHPVERIEDYAFWYGPGDEDRDLRTVNLPEGLISIGGNAFSSLYGLETVTLPESLKEIGGEAFWSCSALTAIRLPDSLERMGSNPFIYDYALRRIELSEDHPWLELIDGALYSKPDKRLICVLSGRETFEVPEGVEIIGAYAFSSCEGLRRVSLPASVIAILEDEGVEPDWGTLFDLECVVVPGSYAERYCAENDLEYTLNG